MNKENNYTSRSGFLKNLSLALVSVFGFGAAGFKFLKSELFLHNRFKFLSVSEANKHINNIHSSGTKQIKPESPPKIKHTSDREQTNEI
jgi:hypothetical protein